MHILKIMRCRIGSQRRDFIRGTECGKRSDLVTTLDKQCMVERKNMLCKI